MNRTAIKPPTLPGTRGVRLLRHAKVRVIETKRDRRSDALSKTTEKRSEHS
jgi:hypothetical protein